jgi:hypothetical protein
VADGAAEAAEGGSPRTTRRSPDVSAAKIAAVAGIVGALVGVVGASVPAYMQISATESQSRNEFLRGKRMEVYSEFNASFAAFNDLLSLNGPFELQDGGVLDQSPFKEPWDRLKNSLAAVRIIGTEPTVAAAERLVNLTVDAVGTWATFGGPTHDADLARLQDLIPSINETQTELTRLIREEVETSG